MEAEQERCGSVGLWELKGRVVILLSHTETQVRGSEGHDFGLISNIVTALLTSRPSTDEVDFI